MKTNNAASIDHEEILGPGWPMGERRIMKIAPKEDFTLLVTFDNGEKRKLDVKALVIKITDWSAPIVQDTAYFKQAFIDQDGNLSWPNEFGWHWSTVYELSKPVN